jgi:acylphosphatase
MYEKIAFVVTGKVQGVCFRAYTEEAARDHDVTGWVRNRPDGRVEGEAWAAPESMEEFIEWLHVGSPHGRVDEVEVTRQGQAEERPPAFGTRYGPA